MLKCIIISPDSEMGTHLEAALQALGEVMVCRTLTAYPGEVDLLRHLRAYGPQVIFLSFESAEKACEVTRLLESNSTGVQIIGIHRVMDPQVLRESMRAGVREFVVHPFEQRSLVESLCGVKDLLERAPAPHGGTGEIFSFLPSKPGVGTTTLALNTAAALARRPNQQVLISDFDLSCGMLRFLLKLDNEYSVVDAVEHVPKDEALWPQFITEINGLHVLHAGPLNPNLRIDPMQIRSVVEFMRHHYDVLVFDMSGNLERYSMELMQESRRILLVCTPELASLHLAREKIAYLRSMDLDRRVSVVLNRVTKRPLFPRDQVEDVLGVQVFSVVSNDYLAVHRAMAAAKCLDANSELGRQYSDFANQLVADQGKPLAPVKRGKFLEFFNVSGAVPIPSEK